LDLVHTKDQRFCSVNCSLAKTITKNSFCCAAMPEGIQYTSCYHHCR